MMIEINFGGKKIFEFKNNNFIQITGRDEDLKRLIINIYLKILNGYRFSDIDIDGMNGYYPEIIQGGKVLRTNDVVVIRLSSIEDIIEQLQIKNNSILLEYLFSLNEELSINKTLNKIETVLFELSVEIDRFLENVMATRDISVITNVSGIDLKKIVKSFINIDFINKDNHVKPLWLLKGIEFISLFLDVIQLIIKKNNNITIIVDGLDIRLKAETYNYFIDKLRGLTKDYPNFKIWLVPKTEKGIKTDCEFFENTYILNDSIISLGNFDITYESICRNYPDNNLPTKNQVLESILKLFSFHHKDKKYYLSKESAILQVFLKLLDEERL